MTTNLSRDTIREVFMAHGFTVKEGQTDLKPYVYDAADALVARAHEKLLADSCKLNEVVFRLAEKLGLATPEQDAITCEIDDVVNRVMETIDEADRRAGCAERRCADLSTTVSLRNGWLDKAKDRAGYHRNVSFDTVFDALLATTKEQAAMLADFEGLLGFYEAQTLRQLIEAQVAHINRLQERLRVVDPLTHRDAFPRTPREG